ncbi:MAG: hypothetical protein LW817_02905 [Candidatus Caenarcaniphilales bacterium]|nr:hypothetical protein [Candidatus Caenarcaniphilales bacterium]
MPKKQNVNSITLRLDDYIYSQVVNMAKAENRSIANLVETFMLEKLEEMIFVNDYEMKNILDDKELMTRMDKGIKQGLARKGKIV